MDGFGNSLADFDDPNVPSLLSIPLLGYTHYDKSIYEATRQRILSGSNQWYFEGKELTGMGSPHTPQDYVWPLAMAVQVGQVRPKIYNLEYTDKYRSPDEA